MQNETKRYQAIIWKEGTEANGKRITIVAENLEEAERKLKIEHGDDIHYTLHNEKEADKPR